MSELENKKIYKSVIIGLDLSTTCTGFAILDAETHALVSYGKLFPVTRGLTQYNKIEKKLIQMDSIVKQIQEVIQQYKPIVILIEEITGSKNRLTQKTLDGFHWLVLQGLTPHLDLVQFFDVTGAAGWRTKLQLRLSDADKDHNKQAIQINKKLAKGTRPIPKIGPKHLACRYVNKKYGKDFNVDLDESDADVCDAIAMTSAFCALHKR